MKARRPRLKAWRMHVDRKLGATIKLGHARFGEPAFVAIDLYLWSTLVGIYIPSWGEIK